MPRKFKVPVAPPSTARVDGGDAKVAQKVKRDHIPQWEKRKWQTSQSLFYPYDKIKNDFELQGLFTRMKEKCWMVIYFDMILMYLPTKDGPPDMEDKLEGKPFAYFFIDNIVDSDKIQADESKLSIYLPTQNSKDDLRIICDTPQQFKEWSATLKELAKMFETTPRDGIETREQVEQQLAQVQKDVPLQFEVQSDHVDWTRAGEWLLEMRRLSDLHRKHLPFIERIERFSQYRIGHIAVYCNFFQGRDRDGPSELITKSKKKVLAFWEAEVERIIKLCEEVLGEPAVDKDHLPFHREDCQIGAYYIDCSNAYSTIVHGVAPSKLVLQKSLATLEELWDRLGRAKTK